MPRLRLILVALALLTTMSCGDAGDPEPAAPPTSPAPEPTTGELLTGAWNAVAMVEDGVREPVGERHRVIVLRADGTSAVASGPGEPDLATVCESAAQDTWAVTPDGSAVEVRFGPQPRPGDEADIVWRIVDLDEESWTFEEGSDLFELERLGSCD